MSPQYHCQFDDFFESVRLQSPELTVPTTWRRLSKLTQDSTSTLWEPQGDAAAELSNASSIGAPQEEADTFQSTGNHFEKYEPNQAPFHPIQGATGDDESISRRTRGRLQHQQCVPNEATEESKRAALARNNLEPGGHGLVGDPFWRFDEVTMCWAHSWNQW